MIARQNRFHGHHSVSRVRGSTLHSSVLSLRFAKTKRDDYRLAVVVSKKVAPKAITRNRIRRRLFEAVRTQKRLQGTPIDAVLYAKTDQLATMPAADVSKEVLELTKKALKRL